MSKVLTDTEMAEIVSRAVETESFIEDEGRYAKFLEDLGDLIADHFGGRRGGVGKEDGKHYVAFHIDECVPENGGIWNDYDMDVVWEDGEEREREIPLPA